MGKSLKQILKAVDEDYRAEQKAKGPSEGQKALADLLDGIGNWPLFATLTFRPNRNEQVVEKKDGSLVQNERVRWCGGDLVVKSRTRNGGVKMGARSVAPGWSADQGMKIINQFVSQSKDLKRTRWFTCVEPHKFRDCYHGHALFANSLNCNWEKIAADWAEKHGRFRLERVMDANGMAAYLTKRYVGKEYGKNEDFRFSFSRNCRRARADETKSLLYNARMELFLSQWKESWMTKKIYHNLKKQLKLAPRGVSAKGKG